MKILHAESSDQILKAFYGFKNKLPLEIELSFFKNALEIELVELGLILNFGADGEHKRILLTNDYKTKR